MFSTSCPTKCHSSLRFLPLFLDSQSRLQNSRPCPSKVVAQHGFSWRSPQPPSCNLAANSVVGPLTAHFWPEPQHVSSLINGLAHNWKFALRNLVIIWIFAGFAEELGYRGYLLNRAADLGSHSKFAYVAAMLFVAVLFGFGHFYKGPAGIVDSTYSGLVLGGVYLLSGRNLWAAILAHGISDSFAILVVFMGWAS